MSLTFITGAPTAGKTAVAEQLSARGLEVHETDDPGHTGIAGWHRRDSGAYVAGYNELDISDPETLTTHVWRLTEGTVDRFRAQAHDRKIYLCGVLREPEELVAVADHVIFLATDEETIRYRFTLPRDVEWGSQPWQIETTIERNTELEEQFRGFGATIINATRPLDAVVDDILAITA